MNHYGVIMAGGGGTRFWPLSRQKTPKQLLNLSGKDLTSHPAPSPLGWTSVLSQRFDTTGFKKAYSDLYKTFTKQIASRRFTISA